MHNSRPPQTKPSKEAPHRKRRPQLFAHLLLACTLAALLVFGATLVKTLQKPARLPAAAHVSPTDAKAEAGSSDPANDPYALETGARYSLIDGDKKSAREKFRRAVRARKSRAFTENNREALASDLEALGELALHQPQSTAEGEDAYQQALELRAHLSDSMRNHTRIEADAFILEKYYTACKQDAKAQAVDSKLFAYLRSLTARPAAGQ